MVIFHSYVKVPEGKRCIFSCFPVPLCEDHPHLKWRFALAVFASARRFQDAAALRHSTRGDREVRTSDLVLGPRVFQGFTGGPPRADGWDKAMAAMDQCHHFFLGDAHFGSLAILGLGVEFLTHHRRG